MTESVEELFGRESRLDSETLDLTGKLGYGGRTRRYYEDTAEVEDAEGVADDEAIAVAKYLRERKRSALTEPNRGLGNELGRSISALHDDWGLRRTAA